MRLVNSFHKFVGQEAPVVIVENSARSGAIEGLPGVTYLRPFDNLHHGLGLDYGLRHVTSEYTLICDPDSAILSSDFAPHMLELAKKKGIAGIESAHWIYHPICLLFRTEWWKAGGISMQEKWPWYDVAGELTVLNQGRDPETVIKRTRIAGPRFRFPIYLIEVYEDLFTNTYLGSRLHSEESDEELGLPRKIVQPLHTKWESWVDGVIVGNLKPSEFPFEEAVLDTRVYDTADAMRQMSS